MPKMVLLSSYVELDSNVLSQWCKKIELTTEVEEQEVTNFLSLGWKEVLGGKKSGSLSLDLFQDPAAAAIDSIMWPLQGEVVPFVARLSNAAVGASNPNWTGSVLVNKWTPIGGEVGSVAAVSVDYPTSGPVLRATA
ncbi:hypothetical protein [Saccharothrix lopnurensis]|uniref:Uncharacterized protein n=1 Tax=Saccharothrix lopnurensis TaxID=1670621 RepID=A0ABW1PGT2_9PSEU